MSAGIDYSFGTANFDSKTGIHFGVISQNSVLQAWADSSEPVYPETVEFEGEEQDTASLMSADSDIAMEIEPSGYEYQGEGYKLTDCLDTDIMVLESPFYTFARFCSPCVPGAGDLDAPIPDDERNQGHGVKAYCLSHDWFDSEVAPYPVYRVADDSLVEAEK